MYARTLGFFSLSFLLSTMVYAMDSIENNNEFTENTETTTLLLTFPSSDRTSVLIPEQSTNIHNNTSKQESHTKLSISVQSKSLGLFTGLMDWTYGEPAMVAYQIAHDKLDNTILANRRRVVKALEKATHSESPENLKILKDILGNCYTKEIAIDDLAVLQLVRKYAHEMRTKEEKQLTEETNLSLQNADKERSALLIDLKKKFIEAIEIAHSIDQKSSNDLDSTNKKHSESIMLGTEVKRCTRMINKHLPADGYDSDTESKYDREFNAHKLGLDEPTKLNHKLNKLIAKNLENLKNIIDLIDKQAIKIHVEQPGITHN